MEPPSEGAGQADTGVLDAAWAQWLDDLSRLVKECLLPLFVLHCKRGQARLPLASIAASLDAAGRPLPGASSGSAARRLADACPEWLAISEATSEEQAALVLLHAEGSTSTSSGHRPASCAGVVARGYSLALPATEGGVRGGHDAQAKRWKAAQQNFYVDARTLERDLSSIEACICERLRSLAMEGSRVGKEPPSLAEGGAGHGNAAATPEAQTRSEAHDGSVLGFVEALKQSPDYHQQVCYVKLFPQRPAKFASFDSLVDSSGAELLSSDAHRALQQMSIDRLFEHQHTALQAVLGRRQHLCLTTGTSSGKSLAFALPILEAYRKDPNTKALILFPTKALAQDQLNKLQKLFQQVCPGLGVCTFDGDTPKDDRPRLLKSCHVFLTNPDMLHFTILASHARWRHVLENLRFMVLDEAHVYRGSFGSHVALLLRRFRRVLKHYRAQPIFIACSATMCSAGAFFSQLMALEDGEEVCVVDEDTAGRGERHFCLWNPPLLEVEEGQQSREQQNARKRARFSEKEGHGAAPRLPPGVGYRTRGSSYDEAAWIISQAARRGHRTVCFLQVRALVEIVLQATNKHLEDRPELQARIAGYRGGYAAVERRKLERRLFTGDLLCVIATNALELGIDIGDLDLTLHVGVPPTVASVWQQAGRAGRRGRPSTAILIAMDAPLEQHFCRHPDDFFARSIEARLPDTSNELLLKGHVLCAAAELSPLSEADARRWFGESIAGPLDELIREGRVVAQPVKPGSVSEAGTMLRITQGKNRKPPKEEVSLRDIDPVQFQVIVRGNSNPLETLDQKFAYMRLHPGAIYLNQQTSYFVEELDLQKRIAWVIPRDSRKIDYYTECREHSTLVLAGGGLARASALPASAPVQSASTPVVRSGRATVHWRMYGFRKKSKKDHSIIDAVDLTLPPVEYQTRATWMDLPGSVLQPLAQAGYSVDRGALHALEHAMIAMAPLCCDVEVMELSCQHTRRDSDPNRYFLLLYELQKGGSGASDKVYKGWEELLSQAVRLMKECPCESGCPNCIVISGCGDYNHGLEKAGALKIGAALGYGGDVATPSQTAGPKDAADHAGAADNATSTMPQPALPPRPKKTFAQCFNCGAGQAAQSVCMDLD